jgi:hypothetical protein
MSKNARSKKNGRPNTISRTKKNSRKPATVRVELTHADLTMLNRAFAIIIDNDPFEPAWIDRLAALEEKIMNS